MARACSHTRFQSRCTSCQAVRKKWYSRLRRQGFVDIEYGLESPRFIAHTPDPSTERAQAALDHYEAAWQVVHAWEAQGRSARDCRIAELYAAQEGRTGTVRGISATLKRERLAPWGTESIQITLKLIYAEAAALTGRPSVGACPFDATEPASPPPHRHKDA